jgi:hypothetical protein
MKKISFRNSLIILILLSSGFILFFYSSIVFHPNQYLFSPGGDGISSYYNSLYHIEHDSSYLNFQGMNYPYGEHITYSVNNPLVTNIIKYFNSFIPGMSNYTVGILNFSMLFSFLLTAFFLFIIFDQLKINRIIAIFSSIAIMVLSPQIFRMQGHISLAYGFFIPLSIWILMQSFLKENKLPWLILLFLNSLIWIMIHPYYTGIIAAFLLCFALFQIFIKSDTIKHRVLYSISLIFIAILPIILYKIFLISTDFHQCRTTKPWGFLIFTAEPEGIFLPHHPPLRNLFYAIFNMNDQNWEGLAYIGLANNIIISGILFFIFKIKFKEKLEISKSSFFQNKFLNSAVSASIIVLFFSMGLPFAIYPKYVPDLFNFLNEFRTPGRFAWMFFYVISIFCVWIFNNWFEHSPDSKISKKKYIILVLFIILPFIEAIPVHFDVSQSISQTPNYLNPTSSGFEINESLDGINITDYQAIIPLPFYHRGSENFTKSPTDKILILSELLSFKSGLPLLSSYLARTSIAEAKNLIQILSPTQYSKPLKDEISGKKPFLILYSKEEISENEKNILKRAELIYEYKEFNFYKIEFDSLFKIEKQVEDTTENFIVKEDFEDMPSSICYSGEGAFIDFADFWTPIYYIQPELIYEDKKYEISFWIYNCGENCGQDQINSLIILREIIKGEIKWISYVNPAYSETIDNCWSKVVFEYELEKNKEKPDKIMLINPGANHKRNFIIDKLLIKEIQ